MTIQNSSEIKPSPKDSTGVKREPSHKKAETFKKHLQPEPVDEEPRQSFFELLREKESIAEPKSKETQPSDLSVGITLPYSSMGMSQTSIDSIAACRAASAVSSPEIAQLAETMISCMHHMVDLNYSETTLLLDADLFANSPFFKAQVVIREFSTAPKAFNIELVGSPEAVALFNNHLGALIAAFETSQSSFKVNRLEAFYTSTEESSLGRKGPNEKKWQKDGQTESDPDQRGSA